MVFQCVWGVGRGGQNSLGKGSAMGLSQAHSNAKQRLGLAGVEGEGEPPLIRTGPLRSHPVPYAALLFYK